MSLDRLHSQRFIQLLYIKTNKILLLLFVFLIDSGEEKQAGLKLPMEIMKSRLLSLQCFSFHFLTDTYWSGDHDFQLPAFKVTLSWQQGTRLRVCSLKGWVGWQGEKEDLWWRVEGEGKKTLKWEACENIFLPSVQVWQSVWISSFKASL